MNRDRNLCRTQGSCLIFICQKIKRGFSDIFEALDLFENTHSTCLPCGFIISNKNRELMIFYNYNGYYLELNRIMLQVFQKFGTHYSRGSPSKKRKGDNSIWHLPLSDLFTSDSAT